MDSKSTSVFAVVVTYNGMQWVDRCMGSLCQSAVPVSVVVVDNASTDGIVQYIQQYYPNVHVIETGSNLGFAKANNLGIRYALDHGADYVFLLNQDAWIENDTMGLLLESFAEHEKAGIVSPMHMNGAGTALDWKFATNLSGDFVSDCYLGKMKSHYEVNYVNAAAWLLSRACIEKVGGFDTNLFVHYGEDIDFVHRLVFWHYSLVVNTHAIAYHDREFRRNCDNEYKQKVFKRDSQIHNMKLDYGNINFDVDIEKEMKSVRRSILKSTIRLKVKKTKRLKEIYRTFEMILVSRKTNKESKTPWL